MSKFYGQVFGASSTDASRRGTNDIRVSAQSWDGSVITTLDYNDEDKLRVRLAIDDDSSSTGNVVFRGTFEDFKKVFDKNFKTKDTLLQILDYECFYLEPSCIDLIVPRIVDQNFSIVNWIELVDLFRKNYDNGVTIYQALYELDLLTQYELDLLTHQIEKDNLEGERK